MAGKYRPRRWETTPADPAAYLSLAARLQVSPVLARVLVNRGLESPAAAQAYLLPTADQLHDPHLLLGAEKAAGLIRQRLQTRGTFLIYGDYDVDGICGTALLVHGLRQLGAAVEYYLPSRFGEGYGLNAAAVEKLAAAGHDFIITVDTGINAAAEAELCQSLGLTLIITDHHEPGPVLPPAAAVINPKQPGCPYPFADLSGTGVAFKLMCCLNGTPAAAAAYADLVALATVADLVPLIGENRFLVQTGLRQLSATGRPGLQALKQVAGLGAGPVNAGHVGFQLAPRLNALGRMGDAQAGVRLLLTADPAEAALLATQLDHENRRRQEVQDQVAAEALDQLHRLYPEGEVHAAVIEGPGWHKGVIGIAAAKVVEAIYRPAVLLSVENDRATGSARSIAGFHLFHALQQCSDLLDKFGGHAMAAGLTMPVRHVPELRRRLGRLAREWLTENDLEPKVTVDAWIESEQVTPELAAQLERLQPCGLGNPRPRLAMAGLNVTAARAVGQDQTHLRLQLQGRDGRTFTGIGFGLAGPHGPGADITAGAVIQALAVPEINNWNGTAAVQLKIDDLRAGTAGRGPRPGPGARLTEWDPLAGLGAGDLCQPPAGDPFRPLAVSELMPATRPAGRLAALAALIAGASGQVLVRVSSPWAAKALGAALEQALRHQPGHGREKSAVTVWQPPCGPADPPDPAAAAAVIAPWGAAVPGSGIFAVVAWHPPYHPGQVPAAAAAHYRFWDEHEWEHGELVLGWHYPERPVLAQMFRLLRLGPRSAAALAADLAGLAGVLPGPWHEVLAAAGLDILTELGLLVQLVTGELQIIVRESAEHGKINLESSLRYRRGQAGRRAFRYGRAAWGEQDGA